MRKIKIGIPRTFHYYRYGVFWKTYFEALGLKVILSPKTNHEIIKLGSSITTNCSCISHKIYIGHILFLLNSCDYIFVPTNFQTKKYALCPTFLEINTELKKIIPASQLISYKFSSISPSRQFINIIKTGLKFTKNPIKIIYSFFHALQKQQIYNQTKENEQKNNLQKKGKKVLIVSQFYHAKDYYISDYIIKYLSNKGINILYSDNLNKDIANKFSQYSPNILNFQYLNEIIGAIYYYRYQINGIILLYPSQCPLNIFLESELSNSIINIPILKVPLEEIQTEINLETKLETFINIINNLNNI